MGARGPARASSSWLLRNVLCALCACSWLVAAPAVAQTQTSPTPASPAKPNDAGADGETEEADSPRAAVTRFLALTQARDYAAAARYLPDAGKRAPELARRLHAVLDGRVRLDLDTLSASATGNLADGLPPNFELLAKVPLEKGEAEPLRLARRPGRSPGWVFARSSVDRIDVWYERLGHRWLLEHLPEPLLRTGPRGLAWWQWLAFLPFLAAAWLLGGLLSRISRNLLGRFAARTAISWDDALLARSAGPLTLGWTLSVAILAAPWMGLPAGADHFLHSALRAALFATLFWGLARTVDMAAESAIASNRVANNPSSRALVPLAARVSKVAILAIAVVALLSELGYPAASLIAGLGLGGLAFALAAQKTVENLFGAFSIGADQPFREGDFVRIEDIVGTVESIGLRSTRIRTLDRTLVSYPNGKLMEMRLETFTARDRIRLACTIGLVYETTSAQLRTVLEGFEHVLRSHEKIWPDAVVVRFKELGASSLDIEVMAWFKTSDWSEFQLIRQNVLLEFMRVVEDAETAFAFPTRTVHLVSDAPAGSRRATAEGTAPVPS